jgi:hypothetical protein
MAADCAGQLTPDALSDKSLTELREGVAMARDTITAGTILGEGLELAKQHAKLLAATGAAIAIGYILLDLLEASGAGVGVNLVVGIFVQYQVLEQLLADRMQLEAKGKRRYLSLFGSGMLSGLGILLGLVLLVIPGVYLAGRWLSSSAFVVAEGRNAADSLGASWKESELSQAAHALTALVSGFPIIVLLVAAVFAINAEIDVDGLASSVVINVLSALSSLAVWVVGAAAYRVQRPGKSELETVFA